MFISPVVSGEPCFIVVFHPLWLLIFPPPLLQLLPKPQEKEFGGDIPSRIEWCSKISYSVHCPFVDLFVSLLLQEETSPMKSE